MKHDLQCQYNSVNSMGSHIVCTDWMYQYYVLYLAWWWLNEPKHVAEFLILIINICCVYWLIKLLYFLTWILNSSAVWRVAWWMVLMFRSIMSLESSTVDKSNKRLPEHEVEGYKIFRNVGIDLTGLELRNLKCSWREFEGSFCRNVIENIAPTRS